jgi:hypothetical protein
MIDLHIHTTATPHHSSWKPAELVAVAAQKGLLAIAVTDHNTTASVASAQEAGRGTGLSVISGVEIDSAFPAAGRSPIPVKLWHTLIYGALPDHPAILALCESVFERNRKDAIWLRTLLAEREFVLSGLDELGRPANVADVGAALANGNPIDRRAGEDAESAGMRYILTEVTGGYNPVGVDEVIAAAHTAGGLAVLAHPGRSKGLYAIPADAGDIEAMRDAGLDGIEVYYPTHTAEQRVFYRELAGKLGLLITGGSDSHHPHQPLAAWPVETLRPFLERLGINV